MLEITQKKLHTPSNDEKEILDIVSNLSPKSNDIVEGETVKIV